ncbi:hypothetical protein RchiOBHm_Chr6g0270091 [Rosa chinensis]|uniref:Uncharacterized protein n=1 Tax=Rosa chinensis TaxID=74649 RepID=A0A2P6PQN1_ROSCH|nr:hypothetical protein RchiOBHm_Chr6g0270091 [Rosa chinensis]
MKVSVDISKIISELKSHEKDFSRVSYDFSKLRICIRKFCNFHYVSVCSISFQ